MVVKAGSRNKVHEPKVHNVWGTEFRAHAFGAHDKWRTVNRCTGFWSTTFRAQHQLFGAPGKWGTGLGKYLMPLDLYFFHDRKNQILKSKI